MCQRWVKGPTAQLCDLILNQLSLCPVLDKAAEDLFQDLREEMDRGGLRFKPQNQRRNVWSDINSAVDVFPNTVEQGRLGRCQSSQTSVEQKSKVGEPGRFSAGPFPTRRSTITSGMF